MLKLRFLWKLVCKATPQVRNKPFTGSKYPTNKRLFRLRERFMKKINIHRLLLGEQDRETFKICSVKFDKASEVEEAVQTDRYNIIWIKEGHGTYLIDFQKFEFANAMMFFLTPGQMYQVLSEEVVEGVRISFEQDFYCVDTFGDKASCNGVLFKNPLQVPYIKLSGKEAVQFEELSTQLHKELETNKVAQKEMVHTLLQLMMIQATRIKFSQNKVEQDEEPAREDSRFLSKLNKLLETHFKVKHAVSDYAELLYVSPKTLHKKIKKLTGRPVSEIIQDRIILEAKREIFHSNKTIKEIGYDLGFDDPAYFSRFFQKYTDESPTEFRQKMKNID